MLISNAACGDHCSYYTYLFIANYPVAVSKLGKGSFSINLLNVASSLRK